MDVDSWMKEFSIKIEGEFKERVLFIGLQGSYGRGEATETSDIDAVVIFDTINMEVLKRYRNVVASMVEAEKACGFVCGRDDLAGWPAFDIFNLYFDTTPVYGRLENVFPFSPSKNDLKDAVLSGISAVYHGVCHNYLFDGDKRANLIGLYKSIFFALRAKYFADTGEYIATKKGLSYKMQGKDKEIIDISLDCRELIENDDEESVNFYSGKLLDYCSGILSGEGWVG